MIEVTTVEARQRGRKYIIIFCIQYIMEV